MLWSLIFFFNVSHDDYSDFYADYYEQIKNKDEKIYTTDYFCEGVCKAFLEDFTDNLHPAEGYLLDEFFNPIDAQVSLAPAMAPEEFEDNIDMEINPTSLPEVWQLKNYGSQTNSLFEISTQDILRDYFLPGECDGVDLSKSGYASFLQYLPFKPCL